MKTGKLCETVLVGLLALGAACPQVLAAPRKAKAASTAKLSAPALPVPRLKPAAPAVVGEPKSVEAQLIAAQNQIATGNLDSGLKAFAEVRVKAPPALAPRIAFVEKLVAIRVADRLGDQAKAAAGLAEALKLAAQPDQFTACWQLGLSLTQEAVAAKSPAAAGLVEFLAAQAAPAMRQAGPHLEVAKLRIAAGQAAAAEAELSKAAPRLNSAADRAAWAAAVADLTKLVDGGQVPQASEDLFTRLRKAAGPLPQVDLDLVEGRVMLAHGQLERCAEAVERATTSVKTAKEQALPMLALAYDLALAFYKADDIENANEVLNDAETIAEALPPTVEVTAMRCNAMITGGMADSAAEVAWNAALSAKLPAQRQQMLLLYVPAAVAAGREKEIPAKLQSMNATAVFYTAAAEALAKAGKMQAALTMLEMVPPALVVEDAKAAADMASVMHLAHQQQKQTAGRQAARCRAVAAEYAAAAKKTTAAKDAKTAAEHTKQATAFQALATEIEK